MTIDRVTAEADRVMAEADRAMAEPDRPTQLVAVRSAGGGGARSPAGSETRSRM